MKLIPIVASMALLLTTNAIAGTYNSNQKGEMSDLQDKLDVNQHPYYGKSGWFNRITLSGLLQAHAMHSTRRPVTDRFGNVSANDIWLSRANLYVDADINRKTTAHVALSTGNTNSDGASGGNSGSYGALNDELAFRKYTSGTNGDGLVDEASVRIKLGHFSWLPKVDFYLRAGRFYTHYGVYERNVVPMPLTQFLTQTQAEAVELGAVSINGWNASVHTFRGLPQWKETDVLNSARPINNFGAHVNYGWRKARYDVDFSVDYMYNIADTNYLSGPLTTYKNEVQGFSLSAKGNLKLNNKYFNGNVDGIAQWTGAVEAFDTIDYAWGAEGARPRAINLGLGYTFVGNNFANRYHPRLGGSYQRSYESVTLNTGVAQGLPKWRGQADLSFDVWKNTDVSLHYVFDRDYGTANGGTGRSTQTVLATLAAKFA